MNTQDEQTFAPAPHIGVKRRKEQLHRKKGAGQETQTEKTKPVCKPKAHRAQKGADGYETDQKPSDETSRSADKRPDGEPEPNA